MKIEELLDGLPHQILDRLLFMLGQPAQLSGLIVGNVDPDAHGPYPLYPRTASMMWSWTSSAR